MPTTKPRLVVAAPASGSGKTTAAVALIHVLQAEGLTVQGFKVGPDYIDGSYHERASGRPARTLDAWMGGDEDVVREFLRGMHGAEVGVIEGVMGLYDSGVPDGADASTAHVAALLKAPVILVVDVSRMAESAAALVTGFARWPGSRLGAVLLNQVGSDRHAEMVADAIRGATGLPILGALPARPDLALPERHLGLVPALEDPALAQRLQAFAESARPHLDAKVLGRLLQSGQAPIDHTSPIPSRGAPVPVAVARDAAFHFYYTANLELLTDLGAEIREFSPLRGEPIPPEARLLYAGGGFPEQFLEQFSELEGPHRLYRERVLGGLPTIAECGGYLWLSARLTGADGRGVPMVGAVADEMTLTGSLQAFGYRTMEATPDGLWAPGTRFRGHAFHHARTVVPGTLPSAWRESDGAGRGGFDGAASRTLSCGFVHGYWRSNPDAVALLLDRVRAGLPA